MSDSEQPPGGQPPSYEPPTGPPGGEPGPPPGPPPGGGGYGPPPQGPPAGGGYGPPSGGGYGPPPGQPPGGGYGPPAGPPPSYSGGPEGYGAPQQLNVGTAISYGWDKFKSNAGVWIAVTLLFFVIQLVVGGIGTMAQGGAENAFDTGSGGVAVGFTFTSIIFNLLSTLIGWVMQAAQTKGALLETEGRRPGLGDFFQWGDRAGTVILTFLMLGILTFVGLLLCFLPGIIFTFFAWYTIWFVMDQGQSPIEALQSSFKLVSGNIGPVFVLALALVGINILGAIPCGLGLLVTIPLTLIATGYSYKFLTRQPIG